jgi:cobalamin biosynthesis Co2+ chelatase CbiK
MIDQYGKDFVEEMIRTKSEPVKMYKADYQEILDELREQIKVQEARLGTN